MDLADVALGLSLQALLFGGILTLSLRFFRPTRPQDASLEAFQGHVLPLEERMRAIEGRIEHLEVRWQGVLEQLTERLDEGNKAWRRARATQSALERRASRDADGEGDEEPPEDAQGVLFGDASGGDTRGMFTVPQSVGSAPEEPWRAAARHYAAQIAGRG